MGAVGDLRGDTVRHSPQRDSGRRAVGDRVVVGDVVDGAIKLLLVDPLGEEVSRHVGVGDVLDDALAFLDAAQERVVAAKEVLGAGGARGARADELVGAVVSADERGGDGRRPACRWRGGSRARRR